MHKAADLRMTISPSVDDVTERLHPMVQTDTLRFKSLRVWIIVEPQSEPESAEADDN
jgi:hypothetical protein